MKEGVQRPLDQCSGSSQSTTIRGCAQAGDLLTLQKLLQGNSSLFKYRNSHEDQGSDNYCIGTPPMVVVGVVDHVKTPRGLYSLNTV
ncbi:hypothetical protein PVL29_007492 [Vitis rotundifolia]|uniref:Uncharacterized protein n=1 Tax=Vitis rotundifolia TaxID=103349 RepID=A0AA38ZZY1_VITRO|nr:hypothetical protein PVL29_007492 [Vitis rotundifolia]